LQENKLQSIPICSENGEQDRGARRGVVARTASENRERLHSRAGVVVKENGLLVSEDEEVSVGAEMRKRVQVVLGAGIIGLCKEWEIDGAQLQQSWGILGDELVIELSPTSHHNHALVRQDLVGRVPSRNCKRVGKLLPVVCGSCSYGAHHCAAVVPASRLGQNPIR